ncbi:hypothetical protein AB0L99_28195 [Streptomyces sp. NPDC051954]|uniref:hypothetical protein n=1 Tax=unclassified Streptomyces TaxID=2593676 RepID=UPI003434CC13
MTGSRNHLVLDRAELGKLVPIDRGGQATIFDLPDLSLAECPGPLVYKEYHRSLPDGFAEPMLAIVAVRDRLRQNHRLLLDRRAVWPLRLITSDNRATGIVMLRLPERFFQDFPHHNSQFVRRPRDAQHLMAPAEDNLEAGIAPPRLGQRGALCRELSLVLGLLHGAGVVYGDLNPRNVLFWAASGGGCGVMLVDCDAVRIAGSVAPLLQLHGPDWFPPEGGAVQNRESDRYKYGLFVLRTLAGRRMGSISRDPADLEQVLDPAGLTLLRRSVAEQPALRPSMRDWYGYWSGVLPR